MLGNLNELTKPSEGSNERLKRLVSPQVQGLTRLTFDPRKAEEAFLSVADDDMKKAWKKLKSTATVRLFLNFENQILYNLSGELLVSVFNVNEEKLGQGKDLMDFARGTEAAIYLPFKDAALADAYFGKINMAKGMLPKESVEVSERDGALVITIKVKKRIVGHAIYHKGVLAISTVGALDSVLKSLSEEAPQSLSDVLPASMLEPGNHIGVAIDTRQLVQVLSAKFEIIRTQIGKFMAPLKSVHVSLLIGEAGIAARASIQMTPAPKPAEDGAQ